MLAPNQKCLQIEMQVRMGAVSKSGCPLTEYLVTKNNGGQLVENNFTIAADIYYSKRQSRYLMEAMLLAPDSTTERICETMSVPREVVEHYREYFFDTKVFRNKFDIVDYISELQDDRDRIVKTQALTEGFSFIYSTVAGGELGLPALEVCKRVQSFAYHMITQAKGHRLTSESAKEAKQWAGVVKTFSDVLAKHEAGDTDSFLSEFRVILESGAMPPDIKAITGEVIHG